MLPDLFWQSELDILRAILRPNVEAMAKLGITQAEAKLHGYGLSVDYNMAHQAAADWASSYTDGLLGLLGTTTQAGVGDAISQWLQLPGAQVGDLRAALLPFLDGNVARADSVAITETTRAVAQGNMIVYDQAGIALPPLFDSGVGTAIFSPPGHPQCRCDTAVARYNDQWLVFWTTNRDDLVCSQDLDTPWGTVAGCSALDGVCLSAGEYLGVKIR